MKPGVKCRTFKGTEKWWVWRGAEVPLHLWKWTHFSASLQTFLSLALVSMVLAIPSQVLHRVNEVLCTTGCLGLFTWAGLYLNRYLLQRSHGGAVNIQVRTGWAAREMEPLDADVFTAGVSSHSHSNPGWQSWFIYETRSPSSLQEGDWVPVCIFPLKERFPWDLNCWSKGKRQEPWAGAGSRVPSGTGVARGRTLVAEGAGEAGQAVAVSGHVVAGPVAVHALGTRLAAVVAVKPRGANWKRNKPSCHSFPNVFSSLRARELSACLNHKPIFVNLSTTVLWPAEMMKAVGLFHV